MAGCWDNLRQRAAAPPLLLRVLVVPGLRPRQQNTTQHALGLRKLKQVLLAVSHQRSAADIHTLGSRTLTSSAWLSDVTSCFCEAARANWLPVSANLLKLQKSGRFSSWSFLVDHVSSQATSNQMGHSSAVIGRACGRFECHGSFLQSETCLSSVGRLGSAH